MNIASLSSVILIHDIQKRQRKLSVKSENEKRNLSAVVESFTLSGLQGHCSSVALGHFDWRPI